MLTVTITLKSDTESDDGLFSRFRRWLVSEEESALDAHDCESYDELNKDLVVELNGMEYVVDLSRKEVSRKPTVDDLKSMIDALPPVSRAKVLADLKKLNK